MLYMILQVKWFRKSVKISTKRGVSGVSREGNWEDGFSGKIWLPIP
jgi:hypothetical protein